MAPRGRGLLEPLRREQRRCLGRRVPSWIPAAVTGFFVRPSGVLSFVACGMPCETEN